MKLIQTITVGAGGASSIQFTSIPQIYTDLLLVLSGRTGEGTVISYVLIEPNSGSPSYRMLRGNGSTVASYNSASQLYSDLTGASATSSTFANVEIYIPNYTSTTATKTISVNGVTENNATSSSQIMSAALLNSTSAITSINLAAADGNLSKNQTFQQYSLASLYGITKGSGGATAS